MRRSIVALLPRHMRNKSLDSAAANREASDLVLRIKREGEARGTLEPLPVLGMSRGEVSGVLTLCVAGEPDANSASGELQDPKVRCIRVALVERIAS